jgi:hypothetical protein
VTLDSLRVTHFLIDRPFGLNKQISNKTHLPKINTLNPQGGRQTKPWLRRSFAAPIASIALIASTSRCKSLEEEEMLNW